MAEEQELVALRARNVRLDRMVASLREQVADAAVRSAEVEAGMYVEMRAMAQELAAWRDAAASPEADDGAEGADLPTDATAGADQKE